MPQTVAVTAPSRVTAASRSAARSAHSVPAARAVVAATTTRATGTEWADYATDLDAAVDRLRAVTATLWGTDDPDLALANASAYLDATGHVVVAWLWLEQALATGNATDDFRQGKRAAARYFQRYELPTVHTHLDLLESLDRTVLDTPETWL